MPKKALPDDLSEKSTTSHSSIDPPVEKVKSVKPKTIKILNWNLGQLNIADIRRHTKLKWKGLAQIMERDSQSPWNCFARTQS